GGAARRAGCTRQPARSPSVVVGATLGAVGSLAGLGRGALGGIGGRIGSVGRGVGGRVGSALGGVVDGLAGTVGSGLGAPLGLVGGAAGRLGSGLGGGLGRGGGVLGCGSRVVASLLARRAVAGAQRQRQRGSGRNHEDAVAVHVELLFRGKVGAFLARPGACRRRVHGAVNQARVSTWITALHFVAV